MDWTDNKIKITARRTKTKIIFGRTNKSEISAMHVCRSSGGRPWHVN